MAAEPEQLAREKIDQLLTAAEWAVQDARYGLSTPRVIVLREVPRFSFPSLPVQAINLAATVTR